jgi:hypothetical protein
MKPDNLDCVSFFPSYHHAQLAGHPRQMGQRLVSDHASTLRYAFPGPEVTAVRVGRFPDSSTMPVELLEPVEEQEDGG